MRAKRSVEVARQFKVTATTPDGQTDTQVVTAADEWKARTQFMFRTTLKVRGQLIEYVVEAAR